MMKVILTAVLSILLSIPVIYAASMTVVSLSPDPANASTQNQNFTLVFLNSDPSKNITQLNITLPQGFSFIPNSNSTNSAAANFSSANNILVWSNTTPQGIVENGSVVFFRFNASVPGISGSAFFAVSTMDNDSVLNSSSGWLTVADITPPTASQTTPQDNALLESGGIAFNCSTSDNVGLSNISLWGNWTGVWHENATALVSGTSNLTSWAINLADGTYKWACSAFDSSSNQNITANRTLRIQTAAPINIAYTISPKRVESGKNISLYVNATNIDIQSVWMNLTYPNGTSVISALVNNAARNISAPSLGKYNVIIFANDSLGTIANKTDYFTARQVQNINLTVVGYNETGLGSTVSFYLPGTAQKVYEYSAADGFVVNEPLLADLYDVQFTGFDGRLSATLKNVNTTLNANKATGLDIPDTPAPGFGATYAVNTSYSFSGASLVVAYNESLFENDTSLGVYKCSNWSFADRACLSSNWTKVTPVAQDSAANTLSFNTTGFSAFSVKQEGYCGDGVCGAGETAANCSVDCECTTGQKRACGSSFLPCRLGNQTCANGAWGDCAGAVNPQVEVCNGADDNCDGVIDNANNGTSVETAKCACFGGNVLPGENTETCNNIDDNCNGQIDEGVTRSCGGGANPGVGVCQSGTSACAAGEWQNCEGATNPKAEICGNGLDDDCNGLTDFNDAACASNVSCSYGAIPSTGCKCGTSTYASGYCCGGAFSSTPCAEFPWYILIVAGLAIPVLLVVAMKILKKKPSKVGPSWEDLEKRYRSAISSS